MFSDLNRVTQKLPTALDQRPQAADTREEIRRHDPDQERKKGGQKGFEKEQGLFGDDQTEISVQSLEAFLPLLLKNYSAKNKFSEKSMAPPRVDPASPTAKAAGAYARTSLYTPVPELQEKLKQVQEEKKKVSEKPTLSEEETQAILQLQSQILELRRNGVQTIFVKKAGSFLESLQNAVKQAL